LGSIPYIAALKSKPKSASTLVSVNEPRSSAAEAFRVVRTNVAFAHLDSPLRTLLVTSAVEAEGKSTVASNIAITFAEAGKRTILVDLDLRRPSIAAIFGKPTMGLTNVLLQQNADVESFLSPTPVPNLRVLATGPLPPNPSELLTSQRMAHVMEELNAIADLVVVDSPPLLALADAAIAARLCDGAILVTRPDRIKRRLVKRARELIEGAGIPVTGVVVNSAKAGTSGYYYGYHSYYGYGYTATSEAEPSRNGRESSEREKVRTT
jgi:capsular exopolysaccharide synthesis family protein